MSALSEPWLLAIDLGTTSLKVGAVSPGGRILDHEACDVTTCRLSQGGAVQDPGSWWDGIRLGVRAVLARNRVTTSALRGVGITGQWGSTVPVTAGGEAAGGRSASGWQSLTWPQGWGMMSPKSPSAS